MRLIELKLHTTSRRLLLAAVLLVLLAAHFFAAKWAFANMAAAAADQTEIADLTIRLAPRDPQTHFAAAVLYDKTFLPKDQARSLAEYETATALSPNNYLLWIEYGKALGRAGDAERAEMALRRALELAPSYAAVHWALGNALVRSGKADEGFDEVRKAVSADEKFASPAAALAYGYFEGDLEKVETALADTPETAASLAVLLAREKRFEDSLRIWRAFSAEKSDARRRESAKIYLAVLLDGKKFLAAQEVAASIEPDTEHMPGMIRNAGFEQAIKAEGAPVFDWQISAGAQPQVLQSDGQRHGGARSLVLIYSSSDGSALKEISQVVAVAPDGKYIFSGYYRTAVKSDVPLAWQVISAADGAILAKAELSPSSPDWREFSTVFTVPSSVEGVILRFVREPCASALCPISGNVWLDDLELKNK